ncbi:NAD(P)-binding domain-containing protein [Nocardia sp. NBC_01499]|uniref:NADPH-dependent F420 reductase n=1 Tax=Nocardia sp. NBC_01499 TaxID=2903597 RepID=UPI00386F3A01
MSTIGILGSGRVATVLANKLATTGHDVTIGTRNADALNWTGAPITVADYESTARRAELVINATPGDGAIQRFGALSAALDGKILVDVSNTHGPSGSEHSLAELLQTALPATRVVKTLNTMFFTVMTDPHSLRIPPTAFLSGNDAAAKTVVTALLTDLGWPTDWIEDLGDLSTARGTEAMMLLIPSLIRNRGLAPFALTIAA